MRKLLGSFIVRAEWNTKCFLTMLDLERNKDKQKKLEMHSDKLVSDYRETEESSAFNVRLLFKQVKVSVNREL